MFRCKHTGHLDGVLRSAEIEVEELGGGEVVEIAVVEGEVVVAGLLFY
jgi:hypothetical protein